MIGESVGAYKIISELGRGGMGVVYLAEHRHMGRRAAIKFLMPELSQLGDRLQRFFLEARAASLVEHDGIVRVFDCDVHANGSAYIVMEYLNGQNLQSYLARRAVPVAEAAAIMVRVADALAAAHDRGIVHRDLKPDNIFVLDSPPGGIKILDFGVAKLSLASDSLVTRTLAGSLVGTPLYMSPEQARGSGGLVDARADVYSMGCILFEMLTGQPPFTHASANELLLAHIGQRPPTLAPILPASLRVLVEGMLAKTPSERPGLREEVIPILQAVTSGRTAWFEGVSPATTAVLPPPAAPSPLPSPAGESFSPAAAVSSVSATRDEGRKSARRMLVAVAALSALSAVVWFTAGRSPDEAHDVPAAGGAAAGAAPAREAAGGKTEPAPVAAPSSPQVPGAPSEAAVNAAASRRSDVPARGAARGRSPRRVASVTSARGATSDPAGGGRVQLFSEPPGSVICVPASTERVGYTNGSVALGANEAKATFILYRAGYHLERVTISAGEASPKTVKLRPLTEDDLAPLPPCR